VTNPKVSVLMSVHNAAPFLGEAVDSVLNQTFRDFEFIIFDDKSSDASLEILKSYLDPGLCWSRMFKIRIDYKSDKRHGYGQGEYVARMDADDLCLPHRLSSQVDFLTSHTDISVVGSAVIFFDGAAYEFIAHQPVEHDAIKCELLFGFTMLHPSVMIRKADFARHSLNYDPHYVFFPRP